MAEAISIDQFAPIQGLTGWSSFHVPTIGSTNASMAALSQENPSASNLWLTSDVQTEGKGRRGREWASPSGNLHASALINDEIPPDAMPLLPLACALSIHDAVASLLDALGDRLKLKWPNDLLIDGKKTAGILIELAPRPDGPSAIVTGFGLNVMMRPDHTPYPATALSDHGYKGTSNTMFLALANAFSRRMSLLMGPGGPQQIRNTWLKHASGIGEPIIVRTHQGELAGRFEALDSKGFLMLRSDEGALTKISAGDVFFGNSTSQGNRYS